MKKYEKSFITPWTKQIQSPPTCGFYRHSWKSWYLHPRNTFYIPLAEWIPTVRGRYCPCTWWERDNYHIWPCIPLVHSIFVRVKSRIHGWEASERTKRWVCVCQQVLPNHIIMCILTNFSSQLACPFRFAQRKPTAWRRSYRESVREDVFPSKRFFCSIRCYLVGEKTQMFG